MVDGASRDLEARICRDPLEVGTLLASVITQDIRTTLERQDQFLLGCPGGRTFVPTYQSLSEIAETSGIDWSRVVIVMMDDYVVDTPGGLQRCPQDVHYSCYRFAVEQIVQPINTSGIPISSQMVDEHLWVPDVHDPDSYDDRIAAAGGVDLFLLASGGSDGHVAFNPPGTPVDSRTRVVELAETTRSDNLATFPKFESIKEVPRLGVTAGLGTIASLSRRVVMALTSDSKQYAAQQLGKSIRFDPSWPATIIHECRSAALYFDRAAFGGVDDLHLVSMQRGNSADGHVS